MGIIFNSNETKCFRKKLRRESSIPERILWKNVRRNRFGCHFRRQHGIGSYIVDFCCRELWLVIEIDGEGHCDPTTHKKDLIRQKYLEGLGFTVKRYSASAVVGHTQDVLDDLYYVCEKLMGERPLPSLPLAGEETVHFIS